MDKSRKDTPGCIIAAQSSQLPHQNRIRRAMGQMSLEFVSHHGDGSEYSDVWFDHRQPAHIVEGAVLTFKWLYYHHANTFEFTDVCSILNRAFEDASLIEMSDCQQAVVRQ